MHDPVGSPAAPAREPGAPATAGRAPGRRAQLTDLSALPPAAGDGVHWPLREADERGEGDLDANLVRLDPGHSIGEHVNDEVDVLIVVLAGEGRLVVDGRAGALRPHVVAHIPRGACRQVSAGDGGLAYLSVHRRRGLIGIGPAPRRVDPADEGGDPACWAHLFEPPDPC